MPRESEETLPWASVPCVFSKVELARRGAGKQSQSQE